MSESIPAEILELLRQRVGSLEELETVLLIRRTSERRWSAVDVAARLHLSDSIVETMLVALTAHGFLEKEGTGAATTWRYAPTSAQLGALVDRLASVYDEHRLEVMRLLSARALERVRDSAVRAFADAFVIGRKKDG